MAGGACLADGLVREKTVVVRVARRELLTVHTEAGRYAVTRASGERITAELYCCCWWRSPHVD